MKILIATDGSDCSKAAVWEACSMIARPEGTEIKIVSCYEDVYVVAGAPYGLTADYYQELADAAKTQAVHNADGAATFIKEKLEAAAADVSVDVLNGRPEQQIIDAAEKWSADLIVVGSHGRNFIGRLLGSVSDAVVHHAPCSVLVVRPHSIGGEGG